MTFDEPDSRDRADRDLTILLTLKDRTPFTARWMEYANSIAFPFKVLIADGSLDDSALTMLADKTRYPGVDYDYVRYPPDNSYTDYYEKMANALERVRTPYVAMADNDDFFVVETLRKSVRFLSENGDYVSCGGQGAIFWMNSADRPDTHGSTHGKNLQWKSTREIRSVEADTARERLQIVSVSKSDTFYYDVKRSDAARIHLKLVRDLDLKDLFLVEHLIWYLAAIAGKTRRLDHLYLARQQDSPGGSGVTHEMQFGDWFGRMLVPSWSRDFEKFQNVVVPALAEADGISLEDAKHCVIGTYRASVAPPLLSDLMNEPTVTVSMPVVVGAIRRLMRLPEDSVFRRVARSLYRRLKWISLDIVYGTELVTIPVPDAERDFEPIRDFLVREK
ncbi:MAG: TIGR00180 family glycosyltransferase [Betaproteobacteria bacterium]|nr:TIGR00180 family glycosyltransferase [Betaproteobacteria bacterium]